jgi:hypothetical protein
MYFTQTKHFLFIIPKLSKYTGACVKYYCFVHQNILARATIEQFHVVV